MWHKLAAQDITEQLCICSFMKKTQIDFATKILQCNHVDISSPYMCVYSCLILKVSKLIPATVKIIKLGDW